MSLRRLIIILSAICATPSFALTTVVAPTYISGELTATCLVTVVPIEFGSLPLGAGQSQTQTATWSVNCTAPTLITLLPIVIGADRNSNRFDIVAEGGGIIRTELFLDGAPFPASGIPIQHPSGIQSFEVSAKITPQSTIAAKFKQFISAQILFI